MSDVHFGFDPDPIRAQTLDRRYRQDLADSLLVVREAGAALPHSEAVERFALALKKGAYPSAQLVGCYHEIVEAFIAEDEPEASRLFAEMAAMEPPTPSASLTIVPLTLAHQGAGLERYLRVMNEDAAGGVLTPVAEPRAAHFETQLRLGLILLEKALPSLHGEIRALIREVVITASDPASPMQFDGGSHHRLWGALFLNGTWDRDPVSVIELMAHETAHCLLFGFSINEALVDNDADELCSSPLRVDPRPMEGIYHATFC